MSLPALARNAAPGVRTPGAGVLGYLPYTVLLVAAAAPLAAGLFLVTNTAWTVIERTALRGAVPAG